MKKSNKNQKRSVIILSFLIFSSFQLFSSTSLVKQEQIQEKKDEPKTAYYSSFTYLWQFANGTEPTHVSLDSNGTYIAIALDTKVVLFNKSSNVPLWAYDTGSMVSDVKLCANGSFLVAGAGNKIYYFNTTIETKKQPIWEFTTVGNVVSLALSENGTYIAAGSHGGGYLLNNTKPITEKNPLWSFFGGSGINHTVISSNGFYTFFGNDTGIVFLLNNSYNLDKKPIWTFNTSTSGPTTISSIAMSADGYYLSVGTGSGRLLHLLNRTNTGVKSAIWTMGMNGIKDVSISPDGSYLTASTDGPYRGLHYLNTSDSVGLKKELWYYQTSDPFYMIQAEMTTHGRYIVAGSHAPATLYLFDNSDLARQTPIYSNSSISFVTSVAISADGKYFAAISMQSKTLNLIYHNNMTLDSSSKTKSSDDDDDSSSDDDESAKVEIPFGHSYIIITSLSLIALVLITKRKINRN